MRELSFDESLSGLCFSNQRGDLLVGFQNNLHYVASTDYLPYKYVDKLLKKVLVEEKIEYCIPFDPLLKFWYDPTRVKTLSLFESYKDIHDSMVSSFLYVLSSNLWAVNINDTIDQYLNFLTVQ